MQKNEDSDLYVFLVATCTSDSRFKCLVCLRAMILKVKINVENIYIKINLCYFWTMHDWLHTEQARKAPSKALQNSLEGKQWTEPDKSIF